MPDKTVGSTGEAKLKTHYALNNLISAPFPIKNSISYGQKKEIKCAKTLLMGWIFAKHFDCLIR
jgi:hypothetical protein